MMSCGNEMSRLSDVSSIRGRPAHRRKRDSGGEVVLDFVLEREWLDDLVARYVQVLSVGEHTKPFVVSRTVDLMNRMLVCIPLRASQITYLFLVSLEM